MKYKDMFKSMVGELLQIFGLILIAVIGLCLFSVRASASDSLNWWDSAKDSAGSALAGTKSWAGDTMVKAKVSLALARQEGTSAWGTKVTVQEERVTLTGKADSAASKELASAVASRYGDVTNNMEAPTISPVLDGVSDAWIHGKILWALSTRPLVNTRISVTVCAGYVVLDGVTATTAEKELAGKLTEGVGGVLKVTNRLLPAGA